MTATKWKICNLCFSFISKLTTFLMLVSKEVTAQLVNWAKKFSHDIAPRNAY